MNYQQLDDKLQGRNRHQRKLANNTYAERVDGEAIAIRLHSTRIIVFHKNGGVRYNSGGWLTATTKNRFNEFGPVGVYQKNHEWFLADDTPFEDGMFVRRSTLPA